MDNMFLVTRMTIVKKVRVCPPDFLTSDVSDPHAVMLMVDLSTRHPTFPNPEGPLVARMLATPNLPTREKT